MAEFSYPHPNFVVSSSGFSVEVLGRTGLRYREAERVMFIDSEVLVSNHPTIATRMSSVAAWRAPHDREPLTLEDRNRILGNIRRAFEWKGWGFQVE